MIVDFLRALSDILWELTCTIANAGLCAAAALIALFLISTISSALKSR